MPENPMSKWERRLARENRRLAKLEVRKAEVDKMSGEEIAVPRAIKYITIGIVTLFLGIVSSCSVCGTIKHNQEQQNVTACERFATQAQVAADCSAGLIGDAAVQQEKSDK